jgi:hypothetical protein
MLAHSASLHRWQRGAILAKEFFAMSGVAKSFGTAGASH